MDRTWTREHDRHIAEKCEGWKQVASGPAKDFWLVPGPDEMHEVDPPDYSTDLLAAIRAAEAWRKGNLDDRKWFVESPYQEDEDWHAALEIGHPDPAIHGIGPSPAAALAWALWRATQ